MNRCFLIIAFVLISPLDSGEDKNSNEPCVPIHITKASNAVIRMMNDGRLGQMRDSYGIVFGEDQKFRVIDEKGNLGGLAVDPKKALGPVRDGSGILSIWSYHQHDDITWLAIYGLSTSLKDGEVKYPLYLVWTKVNEYWSLQAYGRHSKYDDEIE